MSKSSFITESILSGLQFDEFGNLPQPVKRKLIGLMARLSEKSYRRGVHHAMTVGCIHPVSEWRYAPIKKSTGIDTRRSQNVVDRLLEQNPELCQIGLL